MASNYVRKLGTSTIKIIDFNDKIEESLQISDVAIIKPEANTFFECLYSDVPVIVDGTQGFLYQERGVLEYLEENKVGIVLKECNHILELIDSLFSSELDRLKENIIKMELKSGSSEIVKSVLENLHT
jgi:UDP-N-acetylglucosamine:LPS N-acetylglucosamine transferase